MFRSLLIASTLVIIFPALNALGVIHDPISGQDLTSHLPDFISLPYGAYRPIKDVPPPPYEKLRRAYQLATKKLIFSDNDGVLRNKSKADDDEARRVHVVKTLARDPNLVMWINSGRNDEGLSEYHPLDRVHVASEFGTVIRMSGDRKTKLVEVPHAEELIDRIAGVLKPFEKYVEIDHKPMENGVVFIIRSGDPATIRNLIERCRAVTEEFGNMQFRYVESNGYTSITDKYLQKDVLLRYVLALHRADKPDVDNHFILTLGDEPMDEKMHEIAHFLGQHPIIVSEDSEQLTCAKYRLRNQEEVMEFLEFLSA